MSRTVLDIRRRNNQKVRTSIQGERIIISLTKNVPLTLEQRLSIYDPERHGGEQMNAMQWLGAERW